MLFPRTLGSLALAGVLSVMPRASADPASAEDVRALMTQNQRLLERIDSQQTQIDALQKRLNELEAPRGAETRTVEAPRGTQGQVRIAGELAVAFFDSGPEGALPNAEFRTDDARIQVEAAIWRDVYLWAELELSTREANDEYFHLGELYIDFEGVASIGRDRALNLRVGRFAIPFGEEYQYRSPLTNALISHSVTDLWGIDEGVQAYGSLGRFSYNVAVQNGGHKTLRDFNSDKAVVGRIAFDARRGLRLSASAMRTGDLDSLNDPLSELWLANGFLRPLASASTARTYSADLAELDARWQWKDGHLHAATGWIDFEEVRTNGSDQRDMRFHSIEFAHRIAGDLHGAVRYSALSAPDGYPLAGQGNAGKYFHNPAAPHMRELQRFSAGLRYEFGPPLVWKIEYSREDAKSVGGANRGDTDLFASQLGVKF